LILIGLAALSACAEIPGKAEEPLAMKQLTKPRLTGAFYDIGGKESWSADRWRMELGWMHELGMDTVVLCKAANESVAYYPTSIEGMTIRGTDPLASLFTEADRLGMTIYLMPYDTAGYWRESSAGYYEALADKVVRFATELHRLYGAHASLQGFYLMPEFWYRAEVSLREIWINYINRIDNGLKGLDKDYLLCSAPFAGYGYEPDAFEQFWNRMLEGSPGLDLILFQDGIGAAEYRDEEVRGRTYATMREMFERLKKACDKHGRTLWSDLESFEMVGVGYPPHISRTVNQLDFAASLVEGYAAFEYSYLSPSLSLPSWQFCLNYRRYLEDRPSLENIAWQCPYQVSVPILENYPDTGKLLTDGGMKETSMSCYTGWRNAPLAQVIIDLGRLRQGIEALGASFYHDPGNGIQRPDCLRFSVSTDGKAYEPVARIEKPVVEENASANLYQIVLSKPVRARFVRVEADCQPDAIVLANELSVYSAEPELVSRGKSYSFSVAPAREYPDEYRKLTDGDCCARWYAQAGWKDLSADLTITIDLEKTQSIDRLEAWFLRKDAQSVALPRSVSVACSTDGIEFSPALTLTLEESRDETGCRYLWQGMAREARWIRFRVEPTEGWTLVTELKAYSERENSVTAVQIR